MRLCLDGRIVDAAAAGLDPDRLHATFTDGLEESVAIRGGTPRRIGGLEARLKTGAAALHLVWTHPAAQLQAWITRLAEENGHGSGIAHILWGRGSSDTPQLIIATAPRPGVDVVCAAIVQGAARALPPPAFTPLQSSERTAAAARLTQFDAEVAVVLNAAGRVAGTTTGDIFVLRGGTLVTPPISEHPSQSLTRSEIMRMAHAEESPVSLDELRAAPEIAVADGVGLHPVIELDGTPVNGGELGLITSLIAARI